MCRADRHARLEALCRLVVDPDGLDRETLENIEELTAQDEPTEEQRRDALQWWKTCV